MVERSGVHPSGDSRDKWLPGILLYGNGGLAQIRTPSELPFGQAGGGKIEQP